MSDSQLQELEHLVKEGERLSPHSANYGRGYKESLLADFMAWRTNAVLCIEQLGDQSKTVLRDLDTRRVQFREEYVSIVLGALKAAQRQALQNRGQIVPACTEDHEPLNVLQLVFDQFHRVVLQLRHRHADRDTLEVDDEYDVQDLLHALFCLWFEDVREEEWTPSYAGANSRVDFLLKSEQVIVEVKKTRKGLSDKEVGEQLIVDTARYHGHPDCKTLVCFVYDPEHRLKNPTGLERDLSGVKDGLPVHVFIRPEK